MLRMGTRDWGPQPSWRSREGFWEVVIPGLNLEAVRCGVGEDRRRQTRQFQEGDVWEHRERDVKWHGHGMYYHCLKGKARTSKR